VRFSQLRLAAGLLLSLCPVIARAGGPLVVGGPNFGVDGKPITWDPAKMPIRYTLDTGPLSVNGTTTVINNATGKTRVQAMFQAWSSVATAAISYNNIGPIQGVTGGDVKTAAQFSTVDGQCQAGTQSPIIFDADGSLFTALVGDPLIIGFAGPCKIDATTGFIVTAEGVLNGRFQDGVSNPQLNNFELTKNQFDQAFIHEFGHFSGLDHSQINVDVFNTQPGQCAPDTLAGLPIMFPILFCQARLDAGLPQLAPDDLAWISQLYPSASFASSYGTISGTIFFTDGKTPAQDVNVIARRVDDPNTPEDESRRIAVSVVSGYRFTGNPGQSVTANYLQCSPASKCPPNGFFDNNSGGSITGSRDPALQGTYDIPVPAGASYTVEVEAVNGGFTGGSSVGPIDQPLPLPGGIPEFWDQQESSFDASSDFDVIPVAAGQVVNGTDIILNATDPTFDDFEDGGASLFPFLKQPLEDGGQDGEVA
jgi:hypothetical protein